METTLTITVRVDERDLWDVQDGIADALGEPRYSVTQEELGEALGEAMVEDLQMIASGIGSSELARLAQIVASRRRQAAYQRWVTERRAQRKTAGAGTPTAVVR